MSRFGFEDPLWLLALLVLPLIAWRRWRGGAAALRWSSLAMARAGGSARASLAGLPALVGALGVASLIVALARPQLTHRETVVQSDGIDIVLALDVSGSMESPDFVLRGRETTRLEVAKAVIARFVEGREHDRVGLVVFGEEAFTQVPLTLDHEALTRFLSSVEIGMAGPRATAIGQGVAVASKRLADLEAPSRVVILLTDGRSNAGSLDPLQAAEAAAALGIKVYTIGVGADGSARAGLFGMFRSRAEEVDERTLKAVAEATGARFFRATDTRSLREIYETIDELEKTTAEVVQYVHREELYRRALVPGVALILLQLLLSSTVLRRLP